MPSRVLLVTALTASCLACAACGGTTSTLRDQPTAEACLVEDDDPPAVFTPAPEQSHPVLIRNAVVMTATGDTYERGYVYFEEGRIRAVGQGEPGDLATDTQIIDGDGRFVTPGLIDTHSHLGVYPAPMNAAHSDGNEATSPITPQVQAIHSVWPQDPGFMRAIAGGVTTLQILPGSANLIGGLGITLKLRRGARVADDLRFPGAPLGLKMACGENPKRVYGGRGGAPSTRMGSVAMVRAAWLEAERYREQWAEYADNRASWCEAGEEGDEPQPPTRDIAKDHLRRVLEDEILVHVHCYRADEMLVQVQLADELGYTIRSFHHAVEAYKIRDLLAQRDISVSTWADWWGFKIEAYDAIVENGPLITEAGGRAIIHSDSSIGIQRLNQEAAKAYYAALDAGLAVTEQQALQWITLNPAWALGIDDDTGSLEEGKMADLVLWSAHPFSVYAQADLVFVDGVRQYDRFETAEPWSDFELGQWPQEIQP